MIFNLWGVTDNKHFSDYLNDFLLIISILVVKHLS